MPQPSTHNIISRLCSGPIFLSSHLSQRQAPLPKQKAALCAFCSSLHTFKHSKKKQTTTKKRINKGTVSHQPPRSFPSLTPSEQSKAQYVVIVVMIKGENILFEGMGGFASLHISRMQKKSQKWRKRKTVRKTRVDGKLECWKSRESRVKKRNIMHLSTKKRKGKSRRGKKEKKKRGKNSPIISYFLFKRHANIKPPLFIKKVQTTTSLSAPPSPFFYPFVFLSSPPATVSRLHKLFAGVTALICIAIEKQQGVSMRAWTQDVINRGGKRGSNS